MFVLNNLQASIPKYGIDCSPKVRKIYSITGRDFFLDPLMSLDILKMRDDSLDKQKEIANSSQTGQDA